MENQNKHENDYQAIVKKLQDLSPDEEWLPILLEDWILHVYLAPNNHISNGKLAPGSPLRKTFDEFLKDKDQEYIRGLFVYIQPLKPKQLIYGQWESWQYAFRTPLLQFAKKKGTSVYCPYQCVLFDKILPFQDLHFTGPHSRAAVDDSSLVIIETPVLDVKTLDSLFSKHRNRTILSVGNVILGEKYKDNIQGVLLNYDITIYENALWLMLSYRPRNEGEKPTVRLVDLYHRKEWSIPPYALASIKPTSYFLFDTKPFFKSVEMKEATEFNRVITEDDFSRCEKKVNTFNPQAFCAPKRVPAYRQVSGPAIVLNNNNTAIVLGSTDKGVAIPKNALAILPVYLAGKRDCVNLLKQHAKNLVNSWNPLFDSLEIKMDFNQKKHWALFIHQDEIHPETAPQKKRDADKLIDFMQDFYGTIPQADVIKEVILQMSSMPQKMTEKALLAYEFCNKFGWHKNTKYPSAQWADYFQAKNVKSFQNCFMKAKREKPEYGSIIDNLMKARGSDDISAD